MCFADLDIASARMVPLERLQIVMVSVRYERRSLLITTNQPFST